MLGNDDNLLVSEVNVAASGNARAVVKDEALQELAESVREFGVLEPVLVRFVAGDGTDGSYELIAGHRRLAAAKKAGLERIPVRVFKVGDEVAEQIQAIENMHRANLDPMQEARAIQKVQARTGDVRLTAAVMKKTVGYVHRAVGLLSLPKEVTDLIASGELTAAHGHEITRADEKARAAVIKFVTTKDWAGKLPDVGALRQEIAKKVENDLKKAPFVKDEAYAGEVACTACPLNSANHVDLFEGATDGVCMGPSCFSKKEKQFYKDFAESHGKKLEAHKFLGVVADKGSGATAAKGFRLMGEDEVGEKGMKKLMEEKPSAFGWAVVRPGEWSERKRPWIQFAVIETAILPKEKRAAAEKPAARDWEAEQKKNQHFQGYRTFRLLEAAAKGFKGSQSQLVGMVWRKARGEARELARTFNVMGVADEKLKTEKDVASVVEKSKPADLIKALFLMSFESWDLAKRLKEELGLDTAKIVKAADGEASAEWEAIQAKEKEKGLDKKAVEK